MHDVNVCDTCLLIRRLKINGLFDPCEVCAYRGQTVYCTTELCLSVDKRKKRQQTKEGTMFVHSVYVMYILSRVENWEYLHERVRGSRAPCVASFLHDGHCGGSTSTTTSRALRLSIPLARRHGGVSFVVTQNPWSERSGWLLFEGQHRGQHDHRANGPLHLFVVLAAKPRENKHAMTTMVNILEKVTSCRAS